MFYNDRLVLANTYHFFCFEAYIFILTHTYYLSFLTSAMTSNFLWSRFLTSGLPGLDMLSILEFGVFKLLSSSSNLIFLAIAHIISIFDWIFP
jgi:uncharacterized protein YhhL (DUF1145 family)